MPIQFPEVVEVPLARPPLTEVICQVRYPSILRITTEDPADFQERIRHRYPEFQKKHTYQFQLPVPGNPASPSAELQPISFLFTNPNEQVQVALSPSFYAVSSMTYGGWQNFLKDINLVHESVTEIYEPAYSTRIGLRYINRLTTTNTGVKSPEELLKLIRDELTTTLRGPVWENTAEMVGVINFENHPAQLNLRYGYEVDDSTPTFLIDIDYFEEGHVNFTEVLLRYDHFHESIYRAFRWVVTDKALERFGGKVQ